MKTPLLLFAILLLAFVNVFPQTRKIVALGSSTTAGLAASPIDSAWVNRLNHYYKAELHLVDMVYNFGVAGNTFYSAMPSGYHTTIRPIQPDATRNVTKAVGLLKGLPDPANGVIIVNFPSNGYDYMSVEEVINGLQVIYDSATRYGNQCFITTTQPRTDGDFGTSRVKKKMAAIKDAIIKRFGEEHSINFWDGLYNPADTTIRPAYAAGDNMHLNNKGHRILFQRVVEKNMFGLVTKNPRSVVSLYPNPAGERCFITIDQEANIANVLDATGQLVQSIPLQHAGTASSGTIDMSGQDAGLYLVEIPTGDRIEMARLIKQ